jgi:hypothetical protein
VKSKEASDAIARLVRSSGPVGSAPPVGWSITRLRRDFFAALRYRRGGPRQDRDQIVRRSVSRSATSLLREHLSAHRIWQLLVPFLALVAVLVGLLALHSIGSTAHVHAADTGTSSSSEHNHAAGAHDHASGTAHHDPAGPVLSIGPAGLSTPACPEGGGLECCVQAAACVMVLALLSVSIAIGGGPLALVGAVTLLAVVAAFTVRVAPVRPPSLAQLSTFRI